MPPGLY